ncbi:MAG TPA: CehA/McbA family metallohydrolase [Mycobacteriales bacterium]|nr:CehA/McbA family metallohydrolase [Mycobacteriales bacterium]
MRQLRTIAALAAAAVVLLGVVPAVADPLPPVPTTTPVAALYPGSTTGQDPVPFGPVGTIGTAYRAYVGSLHEHSGYSDGWVGSTPATFFASGKHFGLDFMGGADHSDFLGVPLSTSEYCAPNPDDPTATDPVEQAQTSATCVGGDPRDETNSLRKWQQTQVDAADATDDGFAAFRGFEWTSDVFGHISVYFSRNFANAKVDGYPSIKTFYDWLSTRPELGGGSDGLATFNHPGAKDLLQPVREQAGLPDETSRNWNDFAYDPRVDDQMFGVEVYNDHSEYGSTRDSDDYPEGYFAHVLDRGWHVAPVGAEDLGHRRSDDWGGPSWAKTVVLATDRTPAAIRAAMQARRVYAVRDGEIRVDFTLDGEVMGSRLARATGTPLALAGTVTWPGHSGLTLQVVTRHGAVVGSGTDAVSLTRTASDDEPYYFLRVLDGADPVAYSAPFWVTASAAAHTGEWLAGDLHVHTCYSHDSYCPRGEKGSYGGLPQQVADALDTLGLGDSNTDTVTESYTLGGTVGERFLEASLKGLDYLAITDHHSDGNPAESGAKSVHDPGFGTSGVVGVPGYENSIDGHAQMLGATHVYPGGDHSAAAINAMADALRADGGLFRANHPADGIDHEFTDCSDTSSLMWGYGYDVRVDSVEVWNTNHWLQTPLPAAAANDDAIRFWECMLDRGWHVAATGGGDSHWISVAAVQGVGNPTTWVFAPERSARGVLDGIRDGHTSIAIQPPAAGGSQLLLEADADRDGVYESMMGDTVPPGTPIRVRALGLPTAGLVTLRANDDYLLRDAPLVPGGTVDATAPADGWVWASLAEPDAQDQRRAACDPVVGGSSTYCRYELGMTAMTSALYVAAPATPSPSPSCPGRSGAGEHPGCDHVPGDLPAGGAATGVSAAGAAPAPTVPLRPVAAGAPVGSRTALGLGALLLLTAGLALLARRRFGPTAG